MKIRDVINILIDAEDKNKPLVIECRTDTFKDYPSEYQWETLDVVKVVNCTWGTVIEVRLPEQQ